MIRTPNVSLQTKLSQLAVPYVGDVTSRGGSRLSGTQRHRLSTWSPGISTFAREDVPQENPIQEGLHT